MNPPGSASWPLLGWMVRRITTSAGPPPSSTGSRHTATGSGLRYAVCPQAAQVRGQDAESA